MSIASEITRIKGNIADAYEACANKGGTMPPYDAEVEYIESTGNVATSVPCWIDTGIEADRTTVFEVTFAFTQVSPAVMYSGAMGQGYRSGSRFSIAGDDYSNTKWASAYNGWYIHSKDKDTLKHTFKLDAPNSKAYVDDDAVTIGTSYTSEGGSIALFCRNCDGGTSQNWGCNGKMYGSKIWKNGALVRDFIPVRVGDVGYLYDKVSGELFGNKGTGSFALGADVRLAQTSANLAGAIESIPAKMYDEEIEYIASDGNSYISAPNNLLSKEDGRKLSVEMAYDADAGSISFGAIIASANSTFSAPWHFCVNGNVVDISVIGIADKQLPSVGNRKCKVDIVSNSSTISCSVNSTTVFQNQAVGGNDFIDKVGIFALPNGISKCPNVRIYSIKSTDASGNVLADYIPVRKGEVGYLYDKVSGKLFGNAGTGAFVIGADKVSTWVKPADWVDLHKVLADYPAPEGYPYAVAMLLTDTFSDAIPNGNNSGAYRTSSNPDTVVTRNSGDRFLFDPTKHINHTHWLIQYFATSDARASLGSTNNFNRAQHLLWVVGGEGAKVRCNARLAVNLQSVECDEFCIAGYNFDTCSSLQKVSARKITTIESLLTSCFYSCRVLRMIECDEFEIKSNVNSVAQMFYDSGIVYPPEMDTSSVTQFHQMFSSCYAIKKIPQYDFSSAIRAYGLLSNSCSIEELPDVMNFGLLNDSTSSMFSVLRCACKNVPTHLTIANSFALFNGGTWWSDGFKRDTFAAFTDGEVTGGMVFNMNEVSGLTMTVNSAMKALFTTDEQEAIEDTLAGKGWNISW